MGAKAIRDRQHKLIEATLKKERAESSRTHKVLMLGCGDAGVRECNVFWTFLINGFLFLKIAVLSRLCRLR